MRITQTNERPRIVINEANEHGRAHCHVGEREIKVYVFTDGIVPDEDIAKKDLKFIYGYYDEMIREFSRMKWAVEPCPAEFKDRLFCG